MKLTQGELFLIFKSVHILRVYTLKHYKHSTRIPQKFSLFLRFNEFALKFWLKRKKKSLKVLEIFAQLYSETRFFIVRFPILYTLKMKVTELELILLG